MDYFEDQIYVDLMKVDKIIYRLRLLAKSPWLYDQKTVVEIAKELEDVTISLREAKGEYDANFRN